MSDKKQKKHIKALKKPKKRIPKQKQKQKQNQKQIVNISSGGGGGSLVPVFIPRETAIQRETTIQRETPAVDSIYHQTISKSLSQINDTLANLQRQKQMQEPSIPAQVEEQSIPVQEQYLDFGTPFRQTDNAFAQSSQIPVLSEKLKKLASDFDGYDVFEEDANPPPVFGNKSENSFLNMPSRRRQVTEDNEIFNSAPKLTKKKIETDTDDDSQMPIRKPRRTNISILRRDAEQAQMDGDFKRQQQLLEEIQARENEKKPKGSRKVAVEN